MVARLVRHPFATGDHRKDRADHPRHHRDQQQAVDQPENTVRHLANETQATIEDVAYANDVTLQLSLPADLLEEFTRKAGDLTQGRAKVRPRRREG